MTAERENRRDRELPIEEAQRLLEAEAADWLATAEKRLDAAYKIQGRNAEGPMIAGWLQGQTRDEAFDWSQRVQGIRGLHLETLRLYPEYTFITGTLPDSMLTNIQVLGMDGRHVTPSGGPIELYRHLHRVVGYIGDNPMSSQSSLYVYNRVNAPLRRRQRIAQGKA